MSQLWTIARIADGVVLCVCFETPSTGSHPKDNGWPWDATTQKATRIPSTPDPAVQAFDGTAWAEDPAKIEALLIAQVKADNEARVKAVYSQNYGKQKKYSRKQQEVLDFRAIPATLVGVTALVAPLTSFVSGFNAMTAEARGKKFRFAMTEAKLRGVSIDTVIARFETTIETIEQQVANWEAIEQKAILDLKAAATAAAKRAVYAAVNWNWS